MIPTTVSSPLNPDLLGLLASCRAAPADDTPRLVLADWLEEHADASGLPGADDARHRAALIRVQVELARPSFDSARLAQLRATEQSLLAAHSGRWVGDLPQRLRDLRQHWSVPQPHALTWRFSRGLLTVDLYAREMGALELGAWFGSPLGAWVEVANVQLDSVAALVGRFAVTDALRPYLGVRFVAGAQPVPSLLFGPAPPERLTETRVKRLLKSRNFKLVRDLVVHGPALDLGFLRLFAHANAPSVRRLEIKGALSDTDAAFLARADLRTLSVLDVSGTGLGPGALRLIAHAPRLTQLAALTAYRNRFGDDGLVALAESPLAHTLSAVDLQNAGIGDRGVAALVRSPLFARLTGPVLNLSMNPVSDTGARALAECEQLSAFGEFVLRDGRIGDAGARALAESPHVARLTYLDLWKNQIGDAGAAALAASPHLDGLRHLSLRENPIGPAGGAALRERFGDRVKV